MYALQSRNHSVLKSELDGIVLRPTDLYLLGAKVSLHPILSRKDDFQLDFNVATGALQHGRESCSRI